jgi:hypothetical protein
MRACVAHGPSYQSPEEEVNLPGDSIEASLSPEFERKPFD